jgi:hypothetical protein
MSLPGSATAQFTFLQRTVRLRCGLRTGGLSRAGGQTPFLQLFMLAGLAGRSCFPSVPEVAHGHAPGAAYPGKGDATLCGWAAPTGGGGGGGGRWAMPGRDTASGPKPGTAAGPELARGDRALPGSIDRAAQNRRQQGCENESSGRTQRREKGPNRKDCKKDNCSNSQKIVISLDFAAIRVARMAVQPRAGLLACRVVLVGDGVPRLVPPPELDHVVAAAAAQQVAQRVPRNVPHRSVVGAHHLARSLALTATRRRWSARREGRMAPSSKLEHRGSEYQ